MLQLGDGKKLSPSKRDSLPRNLYFSFFYPRGQMRLNSPQNWPRVWWAYHLMADSPALRTIGSRSFLGNVQIYISGLCQDASQCNYQLVGVAFYYFYYCEFFGPRSVLVVATFYFLGAQCAWTPSTKVFFFLPLPQRCENVFQVFFMVLPRYSLPLPRGCREGRLFRRLICRFFIWSFHEQKKCIFHVKLGLAWSAPIWWVDSFLH